MAKFEIEGGYPLTGEIFPQGAKNETLQILCAVLLSKEPVHIKNIPNIDDIRDMMYVLEHLGVNIHKNTSGNYTLQANTLNLDYLYTKDFREVTTRIRGSIMMVAPLLTRFSRVSISIPGGDKIGKCRLVTHLYGLVSLGVSFEYDEEERFYTFQANHLVGTSILLSEASITGTANILMASVLAKGKTIIYNAACEPYIQQLCKMLVSMGARINGIGSNLLSIEGVQSLGGCTHRILPDMIEIGSWISLAALSRSELIIKNVSWEYLGIIPSCFQQLGIEIYRREDDIYIPSQGHYHVEKFIDGTILTLSDGSWPNITPDLLNVLLVTAIQADGSVLIKQKKRRLFFVDHLIEMGANIILCDPHRAIVMGINHRFPLRASVLSSPYLLAGISLLIAALSAKGKSIIHNIEHLGYERIDERLLALGARIKRL